LFYNLLKNIKNVKLIDPYENSIKILSHAMFVATINGTVAIEAALIKKKALVFGYNWFHGCPNIISWDSNIKYQEFLNIKTSNANEILDFFIQQKDLYSVPACQNPSAEKSYKTFRTQDFLKSECSGVVHLMQEFLKGEGS
jgi:capsule polysaccharide export protein KpsC/LpsZ